VITNQGTALRPLRLQIEAGYRFGDLSDPDFSARGGHGFYITIGARVTRSTVENVAEFWREGF